MFFSQGRVKFVMEQSNNKLEPTPNFDCHLAKSSFLELPGSNTHSSFESQQVRRSLLGSSVLEQVQVHYL